MRRRLMMVAPVDSEWNLRSPSAPSAALVIRAIDNPACPLLPVMLDLPGTEPARVEVFDVMGRLMTRRDVTVAAPGALRVEAGAGANLAPGVYWVRLSQAQRRPASRMVVVTR